MELLANGYFSSLSSEQQELLETIIESAKYMKEMLYLLINTYKYDNGNIVLQKSEIDINSLISKCIRENTPLAKENRVNISFSTTLTETNKFIMIDEKQIRRVIINLLNNGINYAFKDSEFIIKSYFQDGKVIISLTNFGPPMDEETKAHLFEKYISGSNKYQKVGFGLGMYLSKKVLDAHDGNIYHIGEDTNNTFCIELPVQASNDQNKIKW